MASEYLEVSPSKVEPSPGRKSRDTDVFSDIEEQNNDDTAPKEDTDKPLLLIAALFKEAALDSPTFRATVNHLSNQVEHLETWLESFIASLDNLSREMEGKNLSKVE